MADNTWGSTQIHQCQNQCCPKTHHKLAVSWFCVLPWAIWKCRDKQVVTDCNCVFIVSLYILTMTEGSDSVPAPLAFLHTEEACSTCLRHCTQMPTLLSPHIMLIAHYDVSFDKLINSSVSVLKAHWMNECLEYTLTRQQLYMCLCVRLPLVIDTTLYATDT